MGTDANNTVLARIEQLEAEGRALRNEVRSLRAEQDRRAEPAPISDDGPVTRRRLIGMAGAVAAGAAGAAIATASPAAAHDVDDVALGVDDQDAGTASTGVISSNASYTLRGGTSGGGSGVLGNSSTGAGTSGGSSSGPGVHGESTNGPGVSGVSVNKAGLQADSINPNTGASHLRLVAGSTTGPPTAGAHDSGSFYMDNQNTLFLCTALGTPGTWVQILQLMRTQTLASNVTTHITGFPTAGAPVLWATNSNDGIGLAGQSLGGIGVSASTDGGVALEANVNFPADGAQLRLLPTTQVGPPTSLTTPHGLGEFVLDQNGALFQCVVAGSPGKWARQAPLVPLAAPFRIYDSRMGQGNPSGSTQGTLNLGAGARPINCTPTPNIAGANLPATTSALLFNVTLANTVGGVGSVVVWANGATEPTTASITWTGNGVVVGNAVTSACDASQDVQIKTTTGSSTHVILDVIGFYV